MFSRQFRALCRMALLWAVPWAVVGLVDGLWVWSRYRAGLPIDQYFPIGGSVIVHAVTIAAFGAISALSAGLLLSKAELGRTVDQVPTWRAMLWGSLGGLAPLAILAVLGLLIPASSMPILNLPVLLSWGLGTGVVSGGLVGASVAVARQKGVPAPPAREHLNAGIGVLLAVICLAMPSDDLTAQSAPRDSAGIQIVENVARRTFPLNLKLGDRPLLTVGGLHDDNPDVEFDSRQGYLRAARLANGGMAVIDVNKVKFFDATGKLLRVSGRDGDGPGEFRYLTSICRTRGDTIVVGDRTRLGVMDGRGTFVRHIATGPTRIPFDGCFDDGTLLLVRYEFRVPTPTTTTFHLSRVRLDGSLVADYGSAVGGGVDMVTQSEVTWSVAARRFFLGDGTRRDILMFNAPTGSPATVPSRPSRSIRSADPVEQISNAEAEERMAMTIPRNTSPEERTQRMDRMKAMRSATTWPLFGRIYAESTGGLWVADYRREFPAPIRYSRFDPNGRLVGRLEISDRTPDGGRMEVIGFGPDSVLIRWHDDDGAAYLSVYPIVAAN